MKLNKLALITLSAISTLVLTACGSSGGHTNHGAQREPIQPKLQAPKTETKPASSLKTEETSSSDQKTEAPKADEPKDIISELMKKPAKRENKKIEQPKDENNPITPIAEKTETPVVEKPETSVDEKPETPVVEIPEVPKEPASQQDIDSLNAVTKEWGDTAKNFVSLEIEGKQLALATLDSATMQMKRSEVETLRDSQGKIVGYYGYGIVEQENASIFADSNNFHYLIVNGKDTKERPIEMNHNMTYQGKMFYRYSNEPKDVLSATVNAAYNADEKQVSMNIKGADQEWILKGEDESPNVDVEDNMILGELYTKDGQANGDFDGEFLGKQGEVIIGVAGFVDHENPKQSWEGVVGAKAE
ncbi:hypothetical protein A1D22_04495 [Pasteurellaceae bacterium LFhippo2]|nr:hypothetical protein [Pasteurellaceae bacterium LFhippo2]